MSIREQPRAKTLLRGWAGEAPRCTFPSPATQLRLQLGGGPPFNLRNSLSSTWTLGKSLKLSTSLCPHQYRYVNNSSCLGRFGG